MLVPPLTPEAAARANQLTRLRLMLVGLAASAWCLVIVFRLVQLQVLDRGFFLKRAARQSERTINLDPRRGPILDRNGRSLAVSVDAESVYAVPQDVERPVQTAAALAQALGLTGQERGEVLEQLRKTRGFVWIKRKVDPARARAVREAQLEGVGLLTENRRYYPKRELAAQVLGYVGIDNAGMSGVEYALDRDIRGHAAKVVVETDARRRPLSHVEKPSTDGATITLTIDEALQHIAETELDRAMDETRALTGMVVVMDPVTGEVLALANRPTFNPNRFADFTSAGWRNRAVADAYEPGSIFKIVAAAGALQEQVAEPGEIIDCGDGHIEIGGVRINDHKVFHRLSFQDVVAESSDIGTIRLAQRLGRENFNRYMRDFGFGVPTGIELPGESPGLLKPLARWGSLSLAVMSFGQEMAVTGVQMAAATAAVANGGRLMKPQILQRVADKDGRVLREFQPVGGARVPAAAHRLAAHRHAGTGRDRRHRQARRGRGLHGRRQDRHRAENRPAHPRLLGHRPCRLVRRLRAGGAAGARHRHDARLAARPVPRRRGGGAAVRARRRSVAAAARDTAGRPAAPAAGARAEPAA